MSRIGTFSRSVNNTLTEADDGGDILAEWNNSEGVTVRVTVHEYPHRERTWEGVQRVAEYWISVEGTDSLDGSGAEAPFEGIHGTVSAAKDAAREIMKDIAGDSHE